MPHSVYGSKTGFWVSSLRTNSKFNKFPLLAIWKQGNRVNNEPQNKKK